MQRWIRRLWGQLGVLPPVCMAASRHHTELAIPERHRAVLIANSPSSVEDPELFLSLDPQGGPVKAP